MNKGSKGTNGMKNLSVAAIRKDPQAISSGFLDTKNSGYHATVCSIALS